LIRKFDHQPNLDTFPHLQKLALPFLLKGQAHKGLFFGFFSFVPFVSFVVEKETPLITVEPKN
jgi:hypothetical protein